MAQQKLPNVPSPRTTIYDNLLGVDFRADQTEVERRRSPMMVNMISDLGGNPIKRDGYRKVGDTYEGFAIAGHMTWGVRRDLTGIIVTALELGQELEEDSVTAITIPVTYEFDEIKAVFGYQHYVFILCWNGLIKVNITDGTYEMTGTDANMMTDGANLGGDKPRCPSIVPQSIIGLQPDATGTAGTVLYGKNLMSIYQTYCYAGDGASAEYKIPLYSKMGSWAKVEVMDSNGNWVTKTAGTDYNYTGLTGATCASLDGRSTVSTYTVDAKITFTAGSIPPSPTSTLAGEDNVRITVAPYSTEQMTVNNSTVDKGFYNDDFYWIFRGSTRIMHDSRLFLSMNEKTYYSEIDNALLIPDNYWFDVDAEIAMYQKMGSNLVIITRDEGASNNTIFIASAVSDTSVLGNTMTATYSVKATNAGIGGISANVGGILNDEPIMLSHTGIYGLLTNWTSEKYAVNRSGRINRKLCKESLLDFAVGAVYNGYYYLAINGNMYILDGRHKDHMRSGETSYECYYFEGLPQITKIFVVGDIMLFTDQYGTYTWNNDLADSLRYYDNLVLDSDGEFVSGTPVTAYWSSVFDDDGCPQLLKTLKKKGTMVVLVPYSNTGCKIRLIKNGDDFCDLPYVAGSIFSFADVDFTPNEFVFQSNTVAHDRFTKKKIKKYKRLQIIVANDQPEPFALTKVVKTYEIGNYAKR